MAGRGCTASARLRLERWVHRLAFILFKLIFTTCDACSLGHAALLEPIGLITRFKHMAMVGEAVQQCRGHPGVDKDRRLFREAQVGGNHHAGALEELGQEIGIAGLRPPG
jgi:hypothetical protein